MSKPLSEEELHVGLSNVTLSETQKHNDEKNPDTNSDQPGRIHVVPIHRRPDLLVPCADLVNSEWQRSPAARIHTLQKSCPEFPISLVLLQGRKEKERVLGHVRLSRVVGHGNSLFVESVVVTKVERGKGYGRTLMEETEQYARSRGFKRLCLTTHDKQHFYAHLGYVLSTPVQNAGSMTTFMPMEMLLKFSRMTNEEMSNQKPSRTLTDAQIPPDSAPSSIPAPPPPPPPLPPFSKCIPPIAPTFSTTASCPPPPPPPLPSSNYRTSTTSTFTTPHPPPPPPPQSKGQLVVQTLTETPYRDAKGVPIFWMHKDI